MKMHCRWIAVGLAMCALRGFGLGAGVQPQRKDPVADWLINYNANGTGRKSYDLKPASSQTTGDLVVVHQLVASV